MKSTLHKSNTRGHADHGWLDSWHTFSFAGYHDPSRMNFGALRVLNDDTVAAGMGFGKHPHDNMEIISIPLDGDLVHEDSTGTKAIIRKGDVQIMSAGTGIIHSEKNANNDRPVKFLQIWILPDKKGVPPRYDQITINANELQKGLVTIVSPLGHTDGVQIHQDAWLSMGKLAAATVSDYKMHREGNGVYAFLLEGDITINDIVLNSRDGLGIWESAHLSIKADKDSQLLLIEVPMNI